LRAGVGSIKGLFTGNVRLEDMQPPRHFRMVVDGKGQPGFLKGAGDLDFQERNGVTIVSYKGDVQVGGTIASVGQRMLQGAMKMLVAAPKQEGKYPGILFYSDIFQLTGRMIRATMRLAGYGFVVAAPEIYHRVEPAGTAIPFDDEGRTRGLAGAAQTTVAEFDADCRAVLDYIDQHTSVEGGKLGSAFFRHVRVKCAEDQ